jgi:cytidine deaminase
VRGSARGAGSPGIGSPLGPLGPVPSSERRVAASAAASSGAARARSGGGGGSGGGSRGRERGSGAAGRQVEVKRERVIACAGAVAPDVPPPDAATPGTPPSEPCALVAAVVTRAAEQHNFVISTWEIAELTRERGVTVQTMLPEFGRAVRSYARAPTSRFHVGAAALGASGAVYLGVNVELPGLPLNASVHAEQFAVVTALRAGEAALAAISATAAPCGHCRQFLNELRGAAAMRVIIPDERTPAMGGRGGHLDLSLSDLLPHAFGRGLHSSTFQLNLSRF